MAEQPKPSKIDSKPTIASWELWSVAQMLVSTHGDDAESHANANLEDARMRSDENMEIVWTGVLTQIGRIREGK